MYISMMKKLSVFFFPFAFLSTINPLFANSNEDNWFNYGYSVGVFSQTCLLANDKLISTKDARNEMEMIYDFAKKDLNRDFYESFIDFASEEKDCIKYLP